MPGTIYLDKLVFYTILLRTSFRLDFQITTMVLTKNSGVKSAGIKWNVTLLHK